MNILLLGSGGREHALAWKLAQSRLLCRAEDKFFAAPGNPGIAEHAQCVALDATDHAAVATFCDEQRIGLVVIGPEAPLVDGLADTLRGEGVSVFGPSKAAAQLEGSKGFTKDLCERAGIPTAGYVRTASLTEATTALDRFRPPYVLKADGLAAGKGVVIAETLAVAKEALAAMFGGAFSDAGAEVVIEEFMEGEEVSFFVLTDGATILSFGGAQDHKRAGDGDTGPNTGGMGAYSPAPILTPMLRGEVLEKIIAPTVRTLADEGMPYSGVLFAGLMLTDQGPKLIEYNCRFGDPECQVLIMRLKDDLGELMLACADSKLATRPPVKMRNEAALCVVMAANGYPAMPQTGGAIGLVQTQTEHAKLFHAGTSRDTSGTLRASGGRVLNIAAIGKSVAEAQVLAYREVDAVDFPTGFCRRDIGWREVERERSRASPIVQNELD